MSVEAEQVSDQKSKRSAQYREQNIVLRGETEAREFARRLARLSNLVREIARAMVRDPDAVQVRSHTRKDHIVVLSIRCNEEDIGLLIGRQGITSQALKRVVQAAGHRLGMATDLRVETQDKGSRT